MVLNCVVIDDEPLARECIADYVREVDFLRLVGTGSNPVELSRLLTEQPVDLLFLDIEMPILNGIEFLRTAHNPPTVVITTAYPSYALEGYQLDVLDYLVKPITFARFFKAVTKAHDYQQLRQRPAGSRGASTAPSPDYFFVKCDYKYERIALVDILFIQALQNYTIIQTTKAKYVTLLSLKHAEQNLDRQTFIRVHKSYLVSIPKIETVDNNEILVQSYRIPISRSYHNEVIERVISSRLWKK